MKKNHGGGVYPFTKINSMGERLTRSAVCTSASSLTAAALDGLLNSLRRFPNESVVSTYSWFQYTQVVCHYLVSRWMSDRTGRSFAE